MGVTRPIFKYFIIILIVGIGRPNCIGLKRKLCFRISYDLESTTILCML